MELIKPRKRNLADVYRTVANQFHPSKNEKISPKEIGPQSNKLLWWLCENGHEWQAICSNRTGKNQGCPYCTGKRITLENCLATTNPELLKSWHPTRNELTPYAISAGSHEPIWWICENGHEWRAVCSSRAGKKRHGCPICSGHIVSKETCLAATHPDLAKEFHPSKNVNNTPFNVKAGSRTQIWWLCKKGHEWEAALYNRSGKNSRGCPFCKNKRVNLENSLGYLFPELIKEWHPQKNKKRTPYNVISQSGIKIWWVCSQGHEWQTACSKRTSKEKTGCPNCNLGWTVEKIRTFILSLLPYLDSFEPAELFSIFQQNGLLSINGKGKAFVKNFISGKIPQDQLLFIATEKIKFAELVNSQTELAGNNDDKIDIISEKSFDSLASDFPLIETKNILASLDAKIFASSDAETIEFLICNAIAKIWRHAFNDEKQAKLQLKQYKKDGEYALEVKQLFKIAYNGTKLLQIPDGYNNNPPSCLPKKEDLGLMQRYVAYQIKTKKRFGNWSGTGAGKTLSAILASRVIEAKLTVICCPNNVIDTWHKQIMGSYPDSIILTKEAIGKSKKMESNSKYLILNYEFFQQPDSEAKLKKMVDNNSIDFIVVDEIHYSKQRNANNVSKRKLLVSAFLSQASEKNPDLRVLGMSATPVINELFEGKSLIELISGVYHNELDTRPTISNCISLFKKFVTHGIRYMPNYQIQFNEVIEDIDCSHLIQEIKAHKTVIELESILTKAKLPFILKQLQPKTIVYTHYYRHGIEYDLVNAITQAGWKVAIFNGETKEGLKEFVDGDADILIATSCIGTGIDGLQKICSKLIINCLPWTHAEYKQLIGRIYRQGQIQKRVDIIIPLTYADVNGERWTWCGSRWKRIQFKKDISDAAVDGQIPEGHLSSQSQAHKDVMKWFERLAQKGVNTIERSKISLELIDEPRQSSKRKIADLTKFNQQLNRELSAITHQRFLQHPEAWYEYHESYGEKRKEWDVIPFQEAIKWCLPRPHWIIGDFGCGEAFLTNELKNQVYSFDHIAINEKVISCDMSRVPLLDKSLDAAVFSLSLMGINYIDYLKEAKRCLKLDGHLWIAEPTSRILDISLFKEMLDRLGFDIRRTETKGKFTFIEALKSSRDVNETILKDMNLIKILSN